MIRALRIMGWASALLFLSLAVLSKVWIEPTGHSLFDARLGGYSVAQAQDLLVALSPAQSGYYLGVFRVLDTVFPILLSVTLAGFLWTQVRGMPQIVRGLIALTPCFYLFMDLSENAAVAHMLRTGPQVPAEAILQASAYTMAKWITLTLTFLLTVWAWRLAPKERPEA